MYAPSYILNVCTRYTVQTNAFRYLFIVYTVQKWPSLRSEEDGEVFWKPDEGNDSEVNIVYLLYHSAMKEI